MLRTSSPRLKSLKRHSTDREEGNVAKNIKPKGGSVKHPSALASTTTSIKKAVGWGKKSK